MGICCTVGKIGNKGKQGIIITSNISDMDNKGKTNANQKPNPYKEKLNEYKNRFKEDWIRKGCDKEMIEFTEDLGKFLVGDNKTDYKKNLSTSQFRNIYGEIKRIQVKGVDKEWTAFHMLRPKLAYVKGRNKDNGAVFLFVEIVSLAHACVDVNSPGMYDNFCNFMEAILAYHRSYNKDNNN